ncbi:hypothetical protein N9L47_05215 [Rhodobacteraceae bacterium]|nr:hypothetical protein [Paracoccaceae bacterium]
MQFDFATFWYPLLVMGLLGYLMWAHYHYLKATTAEYKRIHGKKLDRLRHVLCVAIPEGDDSPADRAYTAFYWAETRRICLKWCVIFLFFAVVKAFVL